VSLSTEPELSASKLGIGRGGDGGRLSSSKIDCIGLVDRISFPVRLEALTELGEREDCLNCRGRWGFRWEGRGERRLRTAETQLRSGDARRRGEACCERILVE